MYSSTAINYLYIYDLFSHNMAPGLAYDYVVWYRITSYSLFAIDATDHKIYASAIARFSKNTVKGLQ